MDNDYTNEQKTKRELSRIEERYKAIYERSFDCIYIHDLESNFLDANDATFELTGYSREELLKANFSTFIDEKQHSIAKKHTENIIKYNSRELGEYKIKCKNGEYKYLQTRGIVIYRNEKPYAILGIGRDITDRKLAEEKLAYSEALLRKIIDTSPNCVYLKDKDGKFYIVNKAMCELYNKSREEMIGKNDIELLVSPGLDLEFIKRNFEHDEEAIKNEKPGNIDEAPYILKDGGIKWFNKVKMPLSFADGQNFLLSIFVDITAQKEDQEEKIRLEKFFLEAQKMEAICTLTAGVAHDFNNILGIILGNAELATDYVPASNLACKNLEEIKSASMRAKEVVRQLLTFSKESQINKQQINLANVVRESINSLGAFIPSNIEIHENFAEKIHFISADPAQIKQITANLCTNAFNAIGQNKGIIEISLANEDIKEPVLIGDEILSAGDYVKLVIKDSGAGIDPQSQKKIFDPYFTTKNMGIEKGRGLGLAVVYGIVKAHKGAVKIESSLGKGTTFQIYFPAVAIVEIPASAYQKDIYIGSEKILFVDDEEMLTDVASQMLSKLGHKVETSNSPAEALNKFKENNSQYKLIITDMSMPEMPGDVLAKKIASIRSDIPIIICSGYIIDFDKLRVENPNVKAVILKPLQRREMEEVISSVLENKDIKDSRILGF